MKLLLRWLINAVVIFGIANYLTGIGVENFYTALIVVVIFGLVNAVIGGLLKLLTLPITLLTLGIFALFINGAMFWLTSTIVEGFAVAGFWPAFWGSLIYSVVTTVTGWFLKND